MSAMTYVIHLPSIEMMARISDPTFPHMAFFHEEGRWHMSSCNRYVQVRIPTDLRAPSNDGLGFTVPAQKFSDVLHVLETPEVTLQLKGHQVEVKSGKSRFSLPQGDLEGFPLMSESPSAWTAHMPARDLRRKFTKLLPAVAKDPLSPLSGICLEIVPGSEQIGKAFATDGLRLHQVDWTETEPLETLDPSSEIQRVVLPGEAVKQIMALINGNAGCLQMFGNQTMMRFMQDDFILQTVLMDAGEYPSVQRLTQRLAKSEPWFQTNRAGLQRLIERGMLAAGPDQIARLETANDLLQVSTTNLLTQEGFTGSQAVTCCTVQQKQCYNLASLQDALKPVSTTHVAIQRPGGSSGALQIQDAEDQFVAVLQNWKE